MEPQDRADPTISGHLTEDVSRLILSAYEVVFLEDED